MVVGQSQSTLWVPSKVTGWWWACGSNWEGERNGRAGGDLPLPPPPEGCCFLSDPKRFSLLKQASFSRSSGAITSRHLYVFPMQGAIFSNSEGWVLKTKGIRNLLFISHSSKSSSSSSISSKNSNRFTERWPSWRDGGKSEQIKLIRQVAVTFCVLWKPQPREVLVRKRPDFTWKRAYRPVGNGRHSVNHRPTNRNSHYHWRRKIGQVMDPFQVI